MGTLVTLGLIATYGGGAYVAAKRTEKAYRGPAKWAMVGLWPMMVAFSPRFRRALKQ